MAGKKKETIKTYDEFLATAEEYSKVERSHQFAETSMNEEIDAIKRKYEESLKDQSQKRKSLSILLEDYALDNISELCKDGKRSFETATMEFSYKKGRDISWPTTLIELVKKSPFAAMVKSKETVDRNSLKELTSDELKAIGLKVKDDVDHLTMKIKTDELGASV